MWRGHLLEGSVIVHGCFCFGNILKIYAFSPNFPLVGFVIGGFYWLFLWNFKEIKHQPFSMTQPILLKNTLLQYVLKISKALL